MSDIPPFSIKALFSRPDHYVIPIYQRNYTWGQGEIKQLIQDVYDYTFDHQPIQQYYIGSLIVFERELGAEIVYETIDGQQRLTTLVILLNALHQHFKDEITNPIPLNLMLNFDSRKKSTATLSAIAKGKIEVDNIAEYNVYIKQRYLDAIKILKDILKGQDVNTFYNYLVEQVFLIRVPVPPKTDLNHYFEIMNNRGEQLEKHEVLKASLLSVLKENESWVYTFNLIWEACADMERYVQYGFSTQQRDVVFSTTWNALNSSNFDELCGQLVELNNKIEVEKTDKTINKPASTVLNILEITAFKGKFELNEDHQDDAPDRFNSVINFSNFLLHVLRIQTQKDISLDDKRLEYFFDAELKPLSDDDKLNFVKEFGFSLLKAKFLFDQYIIKREFVRDKNQWSLKALKRYDQTNRVGYVNTFDQAEADETLNKEVLMLLAMFHVSAPTLVYKHWLNAALYYLFYENEITADKYRRYLQNLAQTYLFDRFTVNKGTEYFDMIYKNKSISKNKVEGKYDFSLLDRGTEVENFVFNYLDYILWKEGVGQANAFEFTFRSSVEHYYPQNPISKEHTIAASIYDLFGNLCLISNSKNSRLSNYMPAAKKDHYSNVKPDSLKQFLMMEQKDWAEEQIKAHGELMKEKLKSFLTHNHANTHLNDMVKF
jgi:hypothetical protein